MAALRAELKEKQNLICEAATALELMDQGQKALKDEKEAALEELQQHNKFLQVNVCFVTKLNRFAYGERAIISIVVGDQEFREWSSQHRVKRSAGPVYDEHCCTRAYCRA